jgi:hypothetical protein
MHQTLDSEIGECYLHAAEYHRSADWRRDWAARQDFLEMQRDCLSLSNYEFAEQLSNFSKPVKSDGRFSAISTCVGPNDLGC